MSHIHTHISNVTLHCCPNELKHNGGARQKVNAPSDTGKLKGNAGEKLKQDEDEHLEPNSESQTPLSIHSPATATTAKTVSVCASLFKTLLLKLSGESRPALCSAARSTCEEQVTLRQKRRLAQFLPQPSVSNTHYNVSSLSQDILINVETTELSNRPQ